MIIITPMGHLRARQAEWLVSAQITLFGAVLVSPIDVFNQPAFQEFARWGDQRDWGALFLLIGTLRIIGLIVNGRRATITSWMRVASSLGGAALFLIAVAGFAASGFLSTWLAIFPPIVISEAANIYFGAVDAGSAWKARKMRRDHAIHAS